MVAQKKKKKKRKPVGRNFLHFSTYTSPKPKYSRLSTLLILPDYMIFRALFLFEVHIQQSY